MTSISFKDDNRKWLTSAADTCFISQDVYLVSSAKTLFSRS